MAVYRTQREQLGRLLIGAGLATLALAGLSLLTQPKPVEHGGETVPSNLSLEKLRELGY